MMPFQRIGEEDHNMGKAIHYITVDVGAWNVLNMGLYTIKKDAHPSGRQLNLKIKPRLFGAFLYTCRTLKSHIYVKRTSNPYIR